MERRGVSQGTPKAYFGKEMSEEVNARLAIRWSVPGLSELRVRVVEFKTGCEKANSHYPAGQISIFEVNLVSVEGSLAWTQRSGWEKHSS